jgi:threonyl-tRNA synthetase
MIIKINKKDVSLPEKSSGIDLAKLLNLTAPHEALAIKINGTLYDLTHTLSDNDEVEMVDFDSKEGKEIFWHTSAHVLAQAVLRLFPNAEVTIGPPIEQGFYYDFANLTLSENDFDKIEKEIKKIISENYKPQRIELSSKQEALKTFANNKYKKELIDSFEMPISAYKQEEFLDLCRGPHLPSIGKIKAFKILKTSAAYWKGDQTKDSLTRIYAISFPDKKLLSDYLTLLEEAKKRDHRILGKQLDLFSFKEEAPGMVFLHPKGLIVWNNILKLLKEMLDQAGYLEIKTPLVLNQELWERSGHWSYYKENMYTLEIENKKFAIKPMNCPGCILWYKTDTHSYRELPLKISEIGLVHRHEMSGSLNGLFRVRSFHQDDAHVFMRPQDITNEILNILKLIEQIYALFGLSYKLELSTRPKKSIGTDAEWERATNGLKDALSKWGHQYKVNEGDGAFYGPKIDVHIKDALGRFWQCATIQLDMFLPQRFELEYVDSDGERKQPIMLHRTILGSLERFFGVITEHFAGKFPLWLSPLGVRIIPVATRHNEYAYKIAKQINDAGIICDVDDTEESVNKKIRNAQLLKINYMLTVGDNEINDNTVSLRTRDNVVHGKCEVSSFIQTILQEKNQRSLLSPFFSNAKEEKIENNNH